VRTCRTNGFTLIELLVVTLLLGLTFTYAMVNMDSLVPGSRLDKAARDIGNLLTRLRGMAVFSGRSHYLEYDLQGDRYRMHRAATVTEREDGADELIRSGWIDLPERIRLWDIQFSDDDVGGRERVTIEFTPNGEVVSHLVNLISDEIAGSAGRYAVELNAMTGLVSYTKGGKEYEPVRDEFEFRR